MEGAGEPGGEARAGERWGGRGVKMGKIGGMGKVGKVGDVGVGSLGDPQFSILYTYP